MAETITHGYRVLLGMMRVGLWDCECGGGGGWRWSGRRGEEGGICTSLCRSGLGVAHDDAEEGKRESTTAISVSKITWGGLMG